VEKGGVIMPEQLIVRPKPLGGWYNFRTGQTDYQDIPTDFSNYIPQGVAEQGLYQIYIEMGDMPIEAALKVLSRCVGDM
jgi:hypothetical protein